MELYQLRSFVAIAEVGQLTRAAEKLHLSQPALSSQLKALEDELELTLFDRTSTGMALTAVGKQILGEAEKILAAAHALQKGARVLKGAVAGKVSIGTLSDPEFIRLGEFMSSAVARYPLLELELHQHVTGAALEHVRDGTLDASFYYGEVTHPTIACLPLREITYRIAAPAEWRERVKDAGWKEIAEQPWIIPPAISTHHQLVYALLRKHGVEPTRIVEADQEDVISSLVISGVGLALIREDLALDKTAGGEMCLWKDARMPTTLWFIHLQDRNDDPVIRALLDLLKETWNLQA
ncbi:MAG TPA: LysR family transcriptional regulator [Burkholderiales bacterium]|nr:LysR family transcriptional regulator [Burkholderiales bacterium]